MNAAHCGLWPYVQWKIMPSAKMNSPVTTLCLVLSESFFQVSPGRKKERKGFLQPGGAVALHMPASRQTTSFVMALAVDHISYGNDGDEWRTNTLYCMQCSMRALRTEVG